jgi:hypothetical protein
MPEPGKFLPSRHCEPLDAVRRDPGRRSRLSEFLGAGAIESGDARAGAGFAAQAPHQAGLFEKAVDFLKTDCRLCGAGKRFWAG